MLFLKFLWFDKLLSGSYIFTSDMSAEEYEKYREKYKNTISYKIIDIIDSMRNNLYDFIMLSVNGFYDIRYYIFSRYIWKCHYLDTKLAKGDFYEFDERLMHGMFNSFVDYIEGEKSNARYNIFSGCRDAKAGIEQLKIEIEECEGDTKEQALWELAAYNWWVNIRPARVDPNEDFYLLHETFSAEELLNPTEEIKKDIELIYEKEKRYIEEDTKWMIELVQRRYKIWT